MKTITKIIATSVTVVALLFTTNANSQSTPKLGIGLNIGVPTQTNGSLAIGGDLRYQFDIDKQLSIPVTAGYTNISYKNSMPASHGYIPVKIGAKYFFNETGAGVYGLAELGAAFNTGSQSGTSLVYSPALGYAWSNGLDLGLKYEGKTKGTEIGSINTGYVGARLAYGFNL